MIHLTRPAIRRWRTAGLALALAFASAAAADAPAPLAADQVAWSKVPSASDIASAQHAAAPQSTVGDVTLRCTAGDIGELRDCDVRSETPRGLGLAQAGLRLTGRFRATTDPAPGARHDIRIDVPIHFTGNTAPTEPPADLGWPRMPPPELAQALFPEAAQTAGTRTGHAVLSCSIAGDGGLERCVVKHEEPAGQGFGAAALAMADLMGTSPWTAAGRHIAGAQVTLPLRFDAPTDAAPLYRGQMANFGPWSRRAGAAGPYTPDRACRMNVRHGLAVLSCQVEEKGKLSQCQLVTDSPRGFGFVLAARIMAQRGVLTAPTAPPSNGRFVPIVAEFDMPHGCG